MKLASKVFNLSLSLSKQINQSPRSIYPIMTLLLKKLPLSKN
uniref:Uncharacterized protein n=1 Tax=Arcella intermedia TaxID=1963864 RepID=A0A6B2LW91_9EUKA